MRRLKKLPLLLLLLLAGCSQASSPPRYRVVYVALVADLFHTGHLNLLRQAKSQAEHLIVGLFSDEDAQQLSHRPILTLQERATLLRSCRYVDQLIEACPVVISDELIERYQIDLVIQSQESEARTLFKAPNVLFKVASASSSLSTEDLIRRILKRSFQGSGKQ